MTCVLNIIKNFVAFQINVNKKVNNKIVIKEEKVRLMKA